MFRNLFCTEQVQIHLRLWQKNNEPIQERDYRTLLEKVRLHRKKLRLRNTNKLSPNGILKMIGKRLSEIIDTAMRDGLGEDIV